MDFTAASASEYVQAFIKDSIEDCAFTLADWYWDNHPVEGVPGSGKKCYERLPNVDKRLAGIAKPLYRFILGHIPEKALRVKNIGCFCK